jgi:hypothetical protein
MASEAQVVANRLNAQKSTGPRTPEGKTVVSQNAVKHGLLAKEVVIKGEDPGEFELYRDQMLGELAPVGQMESVLAERVVSLSWRLQRAERLQSAAFDALDEKHEKQTAVLPVLSPELQEWVLSRARELDQGDSDPADEDRALGRAVVEDFAHARVLDRLLMYERRIEHSLYRTMAELQKQRRLRELEPPAVGPIQERASAACSVRGRASCSPAAPGWEGPPVAQPPSAGKFGGSPPGAGVPHVWEPESNTAEGGGATYGVTTNVPAAEDSSCETNPICPEPSEGQVPCGEEVMNDPSQNGTGKTNPISMGRDVRCEEVLDGRFSAPSFVKPSPSPVPAE